MRPLLLLGLTLALAGCKRATGAADAAVDLEAAIDLAGLEAAPPVFAEVTFAGCPKLSREGGRVRCTGAAPLSVGLVPIAPAGAEIESWLWSAPGGDPTASKSRTPWVRWRAPGQYAVTLVVGGPSGTAMASAEVVVTASPLGGACEEEAQCAPLSCLCASERGDAGAPADGGVRDAGADGGAADGGADDRGCAGALARGLCTRPCADGVCGPGEVCADLSRSAAKDAHVGAMPWRHPICLPPCATDGDCRVGFACRWLPALAPGGKAGGPFTWKRACFADLLGEVGAACADGDGRPAPWMCVTGECARLGARNVCTLGCTDLPCPADAACATFTGDRARPICLRRCDGARPCTDPLLACAKPDPEGALGFTVAGDPNATFCAPRRCKSPAECAPAGSCGAPDGGAGFCQP